MRAHLDTWCAFTSSSALRLAGAAVELFHLLLYARFVGMARLQMKCEPAALCQKHNHSCEATIVFSYSTHQMRGQSTDCWGGSRHPHYSR